MIILKTHYSCDLANTLKSIYGVDADEELERILKFEIEAELKRMNLDVDYKDVIRKEEYGKVYFYVNND